MSKLNYAKEILNIEAKAITAVIEKLDSTFLEVVDLIISQAETSHLVTSGVGKASFVAMKCSATFASTGVPSFFMHPAEALHGDLGRFRKNDIALLISHSGKSKEVVSMIPIIKRIGCKIVSITANKDNELGKFSDYVIETGEISEACPLGLAPTASSAVMLAVCDALAMTVLKERNFSSEDFAMYHPGGSLGRQLMPVVDVMRKDNEHCVVSKELTTNEVLAAITQTEKRPGAASIINSDGTLAGIFTDGDFRRHLKSGVAFLEKPISEVMSKTPTTVSSNSLSAEALRIMTDKKIDQLIVLDEFNKPIGMLDIQDLAAVNLF